MTRTAPTPPSVDRPERVGYRLKRWALGRPLTTASLHEERLPKVLALGVLSSDCISSSAYGSEEMLIVLLGVFGLTGFGILMPLTAVVLGVLILMTLSYREVVMVYTRAGGSYVVARENFGPRVAQIASVALLIDYVVTVAVQSAAGTAAVTSLVPALKHDRLPLFMTIGIVLVLAYGNLRGIREAGKAFAFPTYFFVVSAGLAVVIGVLREIFGDLPKIAHQSGMYNIHDKHDAILTAGSIFVLLKAFANGGSSLTGLEAISNGVSAFKPPEGQNARRTLSIMSILLGALVLGISFLAWRTHATPYTSGSPTVISQVAHEVFGHTWYGNTGWALVQIATALILITGANTPFTGFPFLANFIAGDSFLPRQLTRRGHRLAFSNGIVLLTVLALALLVGTSKGRAPNVNSLVPFYAIGVFTGFTMAGLGMAKYHHTHQQPGWRRKLAINFSGGVVSAVVVLIFAVVKFSSGAWLVILLFPIGWLALVRLNRQYTREARSLDAVTAAGPALVNGDGLLPHYARHTVLVLVDRLDLAVLRALRYAGSLRPTEVKAIHLMIDSVEAEKLERDWIERGIGDRVRLEIVDCEDRRLSRRAAEVALNTVVADRTEVTVLLPRRTFKRVWERLLHDRTADRIAAAVSRIPHVSATIVPFDTTLDEAAELRLEQRQQQVSAEPALTRVTDLNKAPPPVSRNGLIHPSGTDAIGAVQWRQRVTVQGRVESMQVGTTAGRSLEVQLFDDTGGLRLIFFGRTRIPGIGPGVILRVSGIVGENKGHLALTNPRYELIGPTAALVPAER